MSAPQQNGDVRSRADLAARIRQAREYVGMSQDEVATALGISRPAVTLIEAGNRKVEALELDKLARLFGTTTEFLLNGEASTESQKVAFLARATNGLSDSDFEQVLRFTEYLRISSQTNRRGK